ncbi:MAG: tRNA uridine-5-carboxymethylaminomethyl(34) synthesis GTPase MnmE [Pyrinomonadaceae bacterium]
MPQTIVALATPTGRSGIGVVRLSGQGALRITQSITAGSFSPRPRTAHLRQLVDTTSGEVIDEALITYFKAPHSFTGEDVIEISCHGSPVLLRQIIDLCLATGARMAEAGEFSLRALANGQINLAEAEAIRDLIDAQTTASARQAVRQMSGEFSRQLQPLKDELLNVIVVLESALEFVEDDLPATQVERLRTSLTDIACDVAKLADTFRAGHLIRDGLRVAIVGRPNVGKSSLFNALLGSERAIVTEIAGTTRDHLHERFTIHNIPISLIDTAGLRDTTDMVESIGVARSRSLMSDADIVVVMLDVNEEITDEDQAIIESVRDITHLFALNKIDKLQNREDDREVLEQVKSAIGNPRSAIVSTSAKTGEGLDELKRAIIAPFSADDVNTSGFLVTDARHHDLLVRAKTEIENSMENLDREMSEEIVLIGLHNALRYLGEITGETTTEDMLTRIFSTFCIGK